MTLKTKSTYVIGAIVVFMGVIAAGLHLFSENGQFAPASMTNDATKSDQRDAVVSNDVANHKK